MAADGYSEWSLCQAWCKYRSYIAEKPKVTEVMLSWIAVKLVCPWSNRPLGVTAIFQTNRHEYDTCCNIFMNELVKKYNFVTVQQLYNLSDSWPGAYTNFRRFSRTRSEIATSFANY